MLQYAIFVTLGGFMWIGIISTIIAMIVLVWAVNLWLPLAFVIGGVIIVFIVLFAQKSKADERITMLEISNQRLLSRIDSMMDKMENPNGANLKSADLQGGAEKSANLTNLAQDSQQNVESNAESKKAEFRAHINELRESLSKSTSEKSAKDTHISALDSTHKLAQKFMPKGENLAQRFGLNSKDLNRADSAQNISDSLTKPRDSKAFESPKPKANHTSNATDSLNTTNLTNTAFSFEQFLAQKAMSILGGIFFILAAYFCIKYAIEHNFLTPQIRIAGAMCFGALLFMIGFLLERFAQRNAMSARIAQTLIGVASVVEFFAIYGGYALYGFFGEVFSFALLCAVSFGALFLTLRFGLIVGIFGLAGGFATPFLISTDNPNFYFLCGYLLALHLCVVAIWRKNAVIPLLSSACVLCYMWLFVENHSATLGESTFAFFVCCVVFFTLFVMAMQIFRRDNIKSISAVLLCVVAFLGIAVMLNITKPDNIQNALYGFAFIALLCAISAFMSLLMTMLDSPTFARITNFLKIDESIKKREVCDYGAIFGLFLGCAYLVSFISALPSYCIIALEAIFIIAFVANAFVESKQISAKTPLFSLSLLLATSAVFALVEWWETALIFSSATALGVCAFIYAFVSTKDLHSRGSETLLSLNAFVFFGAIFLIAENLTLIAHYAYFYRFLAMWLLAFALLYGLGALRFRGKKLRGVADLAFIGAILFICALFAFIGTNGNSLLGNLFGEAQFAVLGLKNYAIFALICAVNLWLLGRFCTNHNGAENGIILQNNFMGFCSGFMSSIFATLIVLIIALLGSICAKIYYGLSIAEVAFINDNLYFVATAGAFGIFAIAVAKVRFGANLVTNQSVDSLDSGANPANLMLQKALTYIFYLFSAKSLWFYILALWGWSDIFFDTMPHLTQAEFYYLPNTMLFYCAFSLLGFAVIFCLNNTKIPKILLYFLDFIALFLLICAVIGAIHCAFGTQGDIAFGEGGFTYRYALNGANELYAYSAGLVCVSVALLVIGIIGNVERFKHYCFALLCFVALKVFFVDTSSFSSLGKVALFVFMGVAFIGIAMIYNRFVLRRKSSVNL